MNNIAYVVHEGAPSLDRAACRDKPTGIGGEPSGVTVVVNLDRVTGRGALVEKLRQVRAAIAIDHPLD